MKVCYVRERESVCGVVSMLRISKEEKVGCVGLCRIMEANVQKRRGREAMQCKAFENMVESSFCLV